MQVGYPEADIASDYLMDQGQQLVAVAKKNRPDLLVQVMALHLVSSHQCLTTHGKAMYLMPPSVVKNFTSRSVAPCN
jgi:hypothetical protein